MTMERFAWVTAYLAHFAKERPADVLEALGVSDAQFSRAQREHLGVITVAMRSGNAEPSSRFAAELGLAKAKLAEQNPSFDDVRATYGRKVDTAAAPSPSAPANPDETVMMRAYLPNVVLPFRQGEAPKPPPPAAVAAPPVRPVNDPDSTMIADPRLNTGGALPFQAPPVAAGFDPDTTLPMPAPKKPS